MAIRQGNKMMYIGERDVTWWERGEKLAKSQGIPLSKLVTRLLRNEDLNRQVNKEKPIHVLYDEVEEKMAEIRRRLSAGEQLEPVEKEPVS